VFELSKIEWKLGVMLAGLQNEPVHDYARRRHGAGGAIDGGRQQSLPRRPAYPHFGVLRSGP
jgi:hypothetical protein